MNPGRDVATLARMADRPAARAQLEAPLLEIASLIAALTVVVCVAPGCQRGGKEEAKKAAAPPPPPTVTVIPAAVRDVPIVSEFVGTLQGFVDVDIRARVPGYIESQDYEEGSFVQAGQLLFTLDPRDYQAAVQQAQSAVSRAKAAHTNAALNAKRLRPLVQVNAISRQEYDTAVSNARQSLADLKAAQATLKRAQLDLSYTRIATPISGIVGVAQVRVGNLVGQGSPTLLTTVSQVDPIRVVFGIPERDYLEYARTQLGPGPHRPPEIQLVLADGSIDPHRGQLVFANRAVDPNTGTIQVQAVFPNPDRLLRPGQYGRVRIVSDVIPGAVVIPQLAVSSLQGLQQVGVVGQDNVVHVRTVQLGPQQGRDVVVKRGVAPGERVIVEGFDKVKEGQKANPQPYSPQAPAGAQGVGGAGTQTP